MRRITMLTREEATNLWNKAREIIGYEWAIPPNNLPESINKVEQLHALFTEFTEYKTEKPKRDIQVGDIYLDTEDLIIKITRDDGDTVIGNSIGGYDKLTGHNVTGTRPNLVVSKRYKLVEIEEE